MDVTSEEKKEEPAEKANDALEQMRVKPSFAPEVHLKSRRKRLFDDKSLVVEHSMGYQCGLPNNLHLIGKNTVIFAAGCYMVIQECERRSTQKILKCVLGKGITAIAVNPSNDHFATAERADCLTIFVYSYPSARVQKMLKHPEILRVCSMLQFNTDGDVLAAMSDLPENCISLWLWEKEECLAIDVVSRKRVYDLSFSSANTFTTSGERLVSFWSIERTGDDDCKLDRVNQKLEDKEHPDVHQTLHLPIDVYLGGTGEGYLIYWMNPIPENKAVWLVHKMGRKGPQPCHNGAIMKVLLTGDFVMTVGTDGWINLWSYKVITRRMRLLTETAQYEELEPLDDIEVDEEAELVHVVPAVIGDKQSKLWFAQDRTGSIWKVDISAQRESNPPARVLRSLGTEVSGLDYCKVYSTVVACTRKGYVMVYDCFYKKQLCYRKYNAGVSCICWADTNVDPEGSSIIAGFDDGTLRWLKLFLPDRGIPDLYLHGLQKPHAKEITCLSFNKAGTMLATSSKDRTLFFNRVSNLQLYPLAYYEIQHDVEWIVWLQKQKPSEFRRDSEQQQSNDKTTLQKDKSVGEAQRVEDEKEQSVWTETDENLVDVEVSFPLAPISEEIQNLDEDALEMESESLSESSVSSTGYSSPYEEQKLTSNKRKDIRKDRRTVKMVVSESIKSGSSESHEDKEEVEELPEEIGEEEGDDDTPVMQIYDSLLLGCEKRYIVETEPPNAALGSRTYLQRSTFKIKSAGYQVYRLNQLKSYYDLGDRVYDSEDEEHPKRSEMVKQYFKEQKYAKKRASRRKRRRELGLMYSDELPRILCWLPSDAVGRLWLSPSAPDYGYLFEFAFEKSSDGEPVDLIPTRAVELLTSEITEVMSMCMSPCGEFLFLGQHDGQVSVCRLDRKFDVSTCYDFVKYSAHDSETGLVRYLGTTANGKYVVSWGEDGNMFLMRFQVLQYKGRLRQVEKVTFESKPTLHDHKGSEMRTVEQDLLEMTKLRKMGRVNSILEYLHSELPYLRSSYGQVKEKYGRLIDESVLCSEYTTKKGRKIEMMTLVAYPDCVLNFRYQTEKLLEKVTSEYDEEFKQWALFYDKVAGIRKNQLEFNRTPVTNHISGETVFTYELEKVLDKWCRKNQKYNPDVYEFEEYKVMKYDFEKNVKLLEKLRSSLKKACSDVLKYPRGISRTAAMITYNERKLDNIRRLKERIHFEESNPTPILKTEDSLYHEVREKVEDICHAIQSKKHLPKHMKFDTQQKKEDICVFLNKTRTQCTKFNRELMRLDQETDRVEREGQELRMLDEDSLIRNDVKETLEHILDVICVTEDVVATVTENFDFPMECVMIEEDEREEDHEQKSLVSDVPPPTPYDQSVLVPVGNTDENDYATEDREMSEDSGELFDTECDDSDDCFYTRDPAFGNYGKYECMHFVDPLVDTPQITTKNTERPRGSNQYVVKTYKIHGRVVFTAFMKKKEWNRKNLIKDYHFDYAPETSEEKQQYSVQRTFLNEEEEEDLIKKEDILGVMLYTKPFQIMMPIKEEEEEASSKEDVDKIYAEFLGKSSASEINDLSSPTSEECLSTVSDFAGSEESSQSDLFLYKDCFIGIKKQLEHYWKKREEIETGKRLDSYLYGKKLSEALHNIYRMFKHKLDCEVKYHDLVYNRKCRELDIIQQNAPELKSCYDKIQELEDSVKFECTKMELLKLVRKHSEKKVLELKRKSELLQDEFMARIGGDKHLQFFKDMLKRKIQPKETEDGDIADEDEQDKDLFGDEDDEEEEEETFETAKQQEEQTDEEVLAITMDVDPELFEYTKRVRQQKHDIESLIATHQKRLARCTNKETFLMRKIKKSRAFVSERVAEVATILSRLKERYENMKVAVLVSLKRIECNELPKRQKLYFAGLAKNLILEAEYANNITEAAVTVAMRKVVDQEIEKLTRTAHVALVWLKRAKERARALSLRMKIEKRESEVVPLVFQTAAAAKETPDEKKKPETYVKLDLFHYEEDQPEQEEPIEVPRIIFSNTNRYRFCYSNVLEGGRFAEPDYFMLPITLTEQEDEVSCKEVSKCVDDLVDEAEAVIMADSDIITGNVANSLVQDTVAIIESEIEETSSAAGLLNNRFVHLKTNFNGGLIYDIDVLLEMERADPGGYEYSKFYKEYLMDEEIAPPLKEAEEQLAEFEEKELGRRDFVGITAVYTVISKRSMDNIRKIQKLLDDSIHEAIMHRRKSMSHLEKILRLNSWIEKAALRASRFKIKDSMMLKFGRILDLEALLDTLDNPRAHIAKYKMDKFLGDLRKEVKFKEKLLATQKKQKKALVLLSNRLWIKFDKLREKYDRLNDNVRSKRNVLPRISAFKGP